MLLTLHKAKQFTLRAAKDSGLTGITIVEATWLGVPCVERFSWKGETRRMFRVARVVVKNERGQMAVKHVTLRDDGSADVK